MPSPTRKLNAGDVESIVRERVACRHPGPPRIGIELEWLTSRRDDPHARVTPAEMAPIVDAVTPLPCGGRVTFEPGGQVELSTQPYPSANACIDAARTDAMILRDALADAGIVTVGQGRDRDRAPQRVVDSPRYRAMEEFFDADGPCGRHMMCNSASLQINIDADGDPIGMWRAAQTVAPLLGEMFSEPSPNRRELWDHIDDSRSRAVDGDDPTSGWARYALDAKVMFVRTSADHCVATTEGLTFEDWVNDGHELGWPTEADVCEHLTTLFPPVRPRGWFEIRTIDALPDERWPAVVRLASELLLDDRRRHAVVDTNDIIDLVESTAACR